MKKILIPALALLLITQNGKLLAADYYGEARAAAQLERWQDLFALIDEGHVDVNEVHDMQHDKPFITHAIHAVLNSSLPHSRNALSAMNELLNRGAELNPEAMFHPLRPLIHDYVFKYDNELSSALIEKLLKCGADPHKQDYRGDTPLVYLKGLYTGLPESIEHKQELINLFEQQTSYSDGAYIKGD